MPDAVSFSEPGRSGQRMDRADGSANMWANANAAAQAYKAAGDTEKAAEMQQIADAIKQDVLDNLWDSDSKLLLHQVAERRSIREIQGTQQLLSVFRRSDADRQ